MSAPPRPWTGLTPEQSTPGDFALPHPEQGAPNVVLVVLDDTGFAQLGCFGSGIETPNIDRLAANGLRYNRFHVTALCSPTRACLLTGRNPHAVGMGFLTDMPTAYPGYTGRIPKSAATMPRLLRDAGYNTFAVGKWHLVPSGERSHAGTVRPVAARLRLRALLRVPPGRHEPVEPEPRPRQPVRRPARRARRRLPPHRGPRRHRDPLRAGPEARRTRSPVLPLLPTRRDARAASRRAGVGRAVPRPLRRRMGALARGGVRAPGRGRHRPRRHRALGTAAVGAGLGRAQRRRAPRRTRASRRCSPAS